VMAKIAVPWPPLPAYAAGPLWPGAPGAVFQSPVPATQLLVILADPLRVITITWNTILSEPWLYRSAVGVLGFNDLYLPRGLYRVWSVSLLSACLAAMVNDGRSWGVRVNINDSIVVLVVICTGVIAVYMSQYFTWTQVGAETAAGPAGRYLLPLAPAAVLALPRLSGPGLHRVRAILMGLTCLAACVGLFGVPPVIAAVYQH
jgi:uncharacterized membrane protein